MDKTLIITSKDKHDSYSLKLHGKNSSIKLILACKEFEVGHWGICEFNIYQVIGTKEKKHKHPVRVLHNERSKFILIMSEQLYDSILSKKHAVTERNDIRIFISQHGQENNKYHFTYDPSIFPNLTYTTVSGSLTISDTRTCKYTTGYSQYFDSEDNRMHMTILNPTFKLIAQRGIKKTITKKENLDPSDVKNIWIRKLHGIPVLERSDAFGLQGIVPEIIVSKKIRDIEYDVDHELVLENKNTLVYSHCNDPLELSTVLLMISAHFRFLKPFHEIIIGCCRSYANHEPKYNDRFTEVSDPMNMTQLIEEEYLKKRELERYRSKQPFSKQEELEEEHLQKEAIMKQQELIRLIRESDFKYDRKKISAPLKKYLKYSEGNQVSRAEALVRIIRNKDIPIDFIEGVLQLQIEYIKEVFNDYEVDLQIKKLKKIYHLNTSDRKVYEPMSLTFEKICNNGIPPLYERLRMVYNELIGEKIRYLEFTRSLQQKITG
ncbi:hypothetical protein [Francisella philomiragia]|uniref:hypothetical protein n=1 Tax=Francisella philomiragia TaxID=28110 RepID=UPI003513C4D4